MNRNHHLIINLHNDSFNGSSFLSGLYNFMNGYLDFWVQVCQDILKKGIYLLLLKLKPTNES